MLIDPHSIESLLQQVHLEDLVARYVPDLKKKGKDFTACCPFHDEKTPSFTVSPSKGFYKCFGCGAAGGPVKFIMDITGSNYPDSLRIIADHYNFKLEYQQQSDEDRQAWEAEEQQRQAILVLNNQFLNQTRQRLKDQDPGSAAWTELLQRRQLTPEVVHSFMIGVNDTGLASQHCQQHGLVEVGQAAGLLNEDGNDVFYKRLTFPIVNRWQKVVGFGGQALDHEKGSKFPKYKNSPASPVYHKGSELYGMHQALQSIQQKGFAILTEGYHDVHSAHAKAFTNTVGTCGTAFTEDQARMLKRMAGGLLLAFDGDQAGLDATLKGVQIAVAQGLNVKVCLLGEGMDLDEACRSMDWNDLEQLLDFEKAEDGVRWYATHHTLKASDSHEKARVIQKMKALLGTIQDEFLRKDYEGQLYDIVAKGTVTKTDWKKMITQDIASRAQQQEEMDLPDGIDKDDYFRWGIFEKDGRTWAVAEKGPVEIANFTVRILFHVGTDSDKAYRLIRIQNTYGFSHEILANTDELTSPLSFKRLVARKGGYSWKGKEEHLDKMVARLYSLEKTTQLMEVLGQVDSHHFAFSNGIAKYSTNEEGPATWTFHPADDSGICSAGKSNFFIPYFTENCMEDPAFENQRRFRLVESSAQWSDWKDSFLAVYGDKGHLALVWALAAMFRDVIFPQMGGAFPLLNLYGKPQSGKGTMAKSLMNLWGIGQAEIHLEAGSTATAFQRSLSQFKNGVVWLDEYKNSLHRRILGALKGIYDGVGKAMGRMDSSIFTKKLLVNSSVILSGQEIPNVEPALFSRVLFMQFFQAKRTRQESEQLKKLKAMEEDGLSHFLVDVLRYRPLIQKEFADTFSACQLGIRAALEDSPDIRMLNNYSMLLAVHSILNEALQLCDQVKFEKIVFESLQRQMAVAQGSDDVARFWQEVENLFIKGELKDGTHFKIKDQYLYLRLQHIEPIYEREMQMRGVKHFISGSTLKTYLTSHEHFVAETRKSIFDDGYQRCMQFHYGPLDINLLRINRQDDEPHSIQSRLEEAYGKDQALEMMKEMNQDRADEIAASDSEDGPNNEPF